MWVRIALLLKRTTDTVVLETKRNYDQVGPTEGIDMGDDLWVARYILQRYLERTIFVLISKVLVPVPAKRGLGFVLRSLHSGI